jgi:hypothetical protein
LDDLEVEYIVGYAQNNVLLRLSAPWRYWAQFLAIARDRPTQFFGSFAYKSRSWTDPRRIVVKAEVTHLENREPRENPRFVVTNSTRASEEVYGIYRGRGEIENRIKELLQGLQVDRTSCCRFLPNQFRVLQAATAYVLFQELRLQARHTDLARGQVTTIRERLLKIGVWIEESVRRLVFHFPAAYPWPELWTRFARATGAGVT